MLRTFSCNQRVYKLLLCGKSCWICSLLNAREMGRITSVGCVEENGRCLPGVLFKFRELSPMYSTLYFNFEFTSNCEQHSTENCKCISYFLGTRWGTVEGRDSLSLSVTQAEFISHSAPAETGGQGFQLPVWDTAFILPVLFTVYLAFFISGMYAPERETAWTLEQCPSMWLVIWVVAVITVPCQLVAFLQLSSLCWSS
jgi:hypothetical protein